MPHATPGFTDHYIICGCGRVGREVVAALRQRSRAVIAIDDDARAFGDMDPAHTVTGSAADDTTLARACVTRAHGLVAATGSDATNVSIALSAHALNPTLRIVARANEQKSEAKLLRAGATRVVSPYAIGARRMATQLVSPGIVAFLDAIRDAEQVDLWIEEATLTVGSCLIGQTILDAMPRVPGRPNLIAVRRGSAGEFMTNPPHDLRLAAGDTLIVVGSRAHLIDLIARTTPVDSTSR